MIVTQTQRTLVCVQGGIDDAEICATPDTPRGQTKAPRLDIYRPAPRVVVDTGRPHKNKPPQDQQGLPDKSKIHDHSPSISPAKSGTHNQQPVPFKVHSKTSLPKDHSPLVAQAFNDKPEVRNNRELHSKSVQVQTKPSAPHNPQSKPLRVDDLHPVSSLAKNRSQTSQDHGKVQTLYRPSRTELSENDFTRDGGRKNQDHGEVQTRYRPSRTELLENDITRGGGRKNKEKTGVERTHRHHHQTHEKQENKTTRTSRQAPQPSHPASADDDYAVKYRLGLVPRRSNEPKRKSEYQRQFQWRNFERNSPLMSASQVTTVYLVTYLFTDSLTYLMLDLLTVSVEKL